MDPASNEISSRGFTDSEICPRRLASSEISSRTANTPRATVYVQEKFSSKKFASSRISLRGRPRETTFPARTFSRNDLISTLIFLFSILSFFCFLFLFPLFARALRSVLLALQFNFGNMYPKFQHTSVQSRFLFFLNPCCVFFVPEGYFYFFMFFFFRYYDILFVYY